MDLGLLLVITVAHVGLALPAAGVPGADLLLVHGLDLLKTAVLGLDHKEVDESGKGQAAAGEHQAVKVADVVGDGTGEERHEEVPEPVGRGGQGHGRSAVASGVELSNDSPDERTPSGGESDDKEAGENDEDVAGGGGAGRVDGVEDKVTDKRVDEEAHGHPQGTNDEGLAAANILDNPETGDSAANVDGTKNDLGNVRVLETGGLEDGGSVVEEEVGTSKLLARLKDDTNEGATQHGLSEDLVPLSIGASLLLLELLANLVDLNVDGAGGGLETGKAGNGVAGLINAANTVGVTGRLGKEQYAGTENQGPEEGDTVGNTPRAGVAEVVSAIVDHLSSPDTESDEELVARDENTTENGGRRLRLVHGDDDGQGTDTNTGDKTADSELGPFRGGSDLDDCSDAGEKGGRRDGDTATERIGNLASDERTQKGTSGEKGDNNTLAVGFKDIAVSVVVVGKPATEVGHIEETGDLTTVVHKQSATMYHGNRGTRERRNVPDVAKHEATYGGDDTEKDGTESDLLLSSEVDLILSLSPLRRGSRLLGEETHGCVIVWL